MRHTEKLIRRECAFCGKEFWAISSKARFHSGACRQRYFRWRVRLKKYHHSAEGYILRIEEYLSNGDSHETAVRKLHDLARLLSDIDQQHKIRRVS